MFAYCGNNPVVCVDNYGERFVGFGFTVDVTSDRGTYGVEVVIYLDEEVINNSSENESCDNEDPFVLVVYTYSGVSISSDDLGNISNTAIAAAVLFNNDVDLSKLSETNCDEILISLNAFISGQCEVSGGAFLIFGNDLFVSPSSYSGPFDCFSGTFRRPGSRVGYTGYFSSSDTCTVWGLKVTGSTKIALLPFAVSYSKTYYSKPIILAS